MLLPENYRLDLAVPSEAPTLRDHYDAVTVANNGMLNAAGKLRYIDWQHPFDTNSLTTPLAAGKLLVVRAANGLDESVQASMIVDDQPDREIWDNFELPEDAIGLAKFAVTPSMLGQNFGRNVAIPLLETYVAKQGKRVLFLDALNRLHPYWTSQGFEQRGEGSFYSRIYDKEVPVNRYTKELDKSETSSLTSN